MYAKCAQCYTDETSTDTPLPYSKWTVWYKQYTGASYKTKDCPEPVLKLLRAYNMYAMKVYIS
jgi:hypothetical protein